MKHFLTAVFAVFLSTAAFAGSLQVNAPQKWVVIASRTTFEEAKSVAESFVGFFGNVSVVRATNGRYAITLGPEVGFDLIGRKGNGSIPADSYLSGGTEFVERLWVSDDKTPNPVTALQATPPSNSITCRTVASDISRLACYDKLYGRAPTSTSIETMSAPAAVHMAVAPPVPAFQPGNRVEVVSAMLSHQSENYDRQILNDRIELRLTFRNMWPQDIIGVSHKFVITNAFGDIVHRGQDKLDIKVPAGQTVKSEMFYFWDDNPFISDQPYDKLLGPVTHGTYKINVTVEQVVFASGQSVAQAVN